MGKYVLVYLPSKEVEDYGSKLVREVGPKFGENYLIENPRPFHVTLKSPFYMENTAELEKVLEKFVKNNNVSKIEVEGFNNFRRFVAFLDVHFSKEGIEMQKKLLEEVKVFKEIELKEFDLKWHPHLTISYGNTPESFDGIWEYLQNLPVPKFKMNFDNITLLKKVEKGWKVYRRFYIK
jgi:2'-5' RNA ligase